MRRMLLLLFTFSFCILYAQEPKLMLPIGHTGTINAAQFSPDNKTVLTASLEDKTVKTWDVLTGKLLADLKLDQDFAKFSSDGKKILTWWSDDHLYSKDSTAKIWDAFTGKVLIILKGNDKIKEAHFFPDDKTIFTVSDFAVNTWDAITGAKKYIFKDPAGIQSAQIAADGKKLLTINRNYMVNIWDTEIGTLLAKIPDTCTAAKFSSDGKKIVTIFTIPGTKFLREKKGLLKPINTFEEKVLTLASTSKVWDADKGFLISTLKGHVNDIIDAKFRFDDKTILTVALDSTVKIWKPSNGFLIADLKLDNESYAELSPNGKQVLTYPNYNDPEFRDKIMEFSAKIWDSSTASVFLVLKSNYIIKKAHFFPDSKKILTVYDKGVSIWDASTGTILQDLKGEKNVLFALISSDNTKILLSYDDTTAKIWNTSSGKVIAELKTRTKNITNIPAQFSHDGKKIITSIGNNRLKLWSAFEGKGLVDLLNNAPIKFAQYSSHTERILTCTDGDSTAKIWNALTGQLVGILHNNNTIDEANFSPDGKKLVTFSYGDQPGTAQIWNSATANLIITLKGHSRSINSARFSPDGNMIVTASEDKTVKIWNAITGKLIHSLVHKISITAYFSPDSRKVMSLGKVDVNVWNVSTGRLLVTLRPVDPDDRLNDAKFSPDGKKILTLYNQKTALLWDALTGEPLLTLSRDKYDQTYPIISGSFAFSPDGKKIVIAFDGTAIIWNAETGKIIYDFRGKIEFVESVEFSPDGKKIIVTSEDNTAKLVDTEEGKVLYTFFAIDSTDFFGLIKIGYYHCSPNSSKILHYVTQDLKVITFEQLDIKYNRPDIVLQVLGNTDTSLINSYKKAYAKRIKRLGFDTTQFLGTLNVPDADFANRKELESEYEKRKDQLTLHIIARDTSFLLDRFNLWINEVPLFGTRGISLKWRNKKNFDTTLTVTLSDSINRIETSVTNVSGLESYRMPLQVNYKPEKPAKEKLYFVGIGIDQFTDAKQNLRYSVKDIRNLAENLKKKYGDNLVIVDTLFDKRVTDSNIIALKRKLLDSTKINDKVILSYSGHGLLSDSFDYYLSTHVVNFKKPEEGGLPYDALENLLDDIPARKKLMFIDACHSGEVDKEEMAKLQRLLIEDPSKRGTIVFNTDSAKLGMKNSFELMQELFVNVGRSSGATIISAAGGMQLAQEGGGRENGVFTWSVLEYMDKHPSATVTELKNYVNKRVPELTKGLQQPTTRTETLAVDWRVW